MKQSWLEKYHQLRDHTGTPRDEFEAFIHLSENPAIDFNENEAWDKINNRLGLSPVEKSFNLSVVWRVAAVFVLIALSLVLYLKVSEAPHELITVTTQDESIFHKLPDGSTVYLSANSSISYDKAFEDRIVNFEGLAYYDVTKSGSTFTVKMNDLSLMVLGTSFSLEVSKDYLKSYVEEGLVQIGNESVAQKVKPGELLTYNKAKNKFYLKDNSDPNILSWKTGKFIFQNTPFNEVVQYLEKYYQVDFLSLNGYQQCAITAQFDKQELDEVLSILSEVMNAEFQISKSKVKTLGKGCN